MSYYTDCVSLCDIDEIDGTDRANDEERNVLENIYNHWFFTYSKIFLHCPKRYICDTCFPQSVRYRINFQIRNICIHIVSCRQMLCSLEVKGGGWEDKRGPS